MIASKAVNTDQDTVKKFSNRLRQLKHLYGIGDGVASSPTQFPENLPYPFEGWEGFSKRKTLGSVRAIALDDKMYMLKTMSPVKSSS
ncbi:MAG: hypothetical protein V7K42_14515 [Nostoc sp.]